MSPEAIAVIISASGFILSMAGTVAIVSFRIGGASNRFDRMEKDINNMATKDQLSDVKADIAEIKGMFTMKLKE